MNRIQALVEQAKLRLERARADHDVVDIAVRTFKRYGDDDGGPLAAGLTYYTFFSFFPLLMFGVAILGYVTAGNPDLREDIIENAFKSVPMIRDALIPPGLDDIIRNRQEIAGIGFVLAIYAGSGAVVALEHALNRIYRVEVEGNWFQKRAKSLVWLAILGGLVLASLAASTISNWSEQIFDFLEPLGDLMPVVVFALLGILISTVAFSAAYKFLPKRDATWREVLPGALVGAVAFEILKYAGTFYVDRGKDARNATFGIFATAATLLVVAFLMSQLTLLCAELNAVLAERRLTRQSQVTKEGGNE